MGGLIETEGAVLVEGRLFLFEITAVCGRARTGTSTNPGLPKSHGGACGWSSRKPWSQSKILAYRQADCHSGFADSMEMWACVRKILSLEK